MVNLDLVELRPKLELENGRRQVDHLRGELIFLLSQLMIEKHISEESVESECARKTFSNLHCELP